MNALVRACLATAVVLAAWFGAHAGMSGAGQESSHVSAMDLSGPVDMAMDTVAEPTVHESHQHCPMGYCATACFSAVTGQAQQVPATLIPVGLVTTIPDPATVSVFPEVPPPQLS